jgi:hypothetical protein
VNAEANALKFQWKQGLRSPSGIGEKSVIEQPYHIGRVGQWLRGWVPPQGRDDELMLYLSDSTVVIFPSSWYRFPASVLLLKYYAFPPLSQFDPRLMGISFTPQGIVLGETHHLRFAARRTSGRGESCAAGVRHRCGDRRAGECPHAIRSDPSSLCVLQKPKPFSQSNAQGAPNYSSLPQHWRSFLSFLDTCITWTLCLVFPSPAAVLPVFPRWFQTTGNSRPPQRIIGTRGC